MEKSLTLNCRRKLLCQVVLCTTKIQLPKRVVCNHGIYPKVVRLTRIDNNKRQREILE